MSRRFMSNFLTKKVSRLTCFQGFLHKVASKCQRAIFELDSRIFVLVWNMQRNCPNFGLCWESGHLDGHQWHSKDSTWLDRTMNKISWISYYKFQWISLILLWYMSDERPFTRSSQTELEYIYSRNHFDIYVLNYCDRL